MEANRTCDWCGTVEQAIYQGVKRKNWNIVRCAKCHKLKCEKDGGGRVVNGSVIPCMIKKCPVCKEFACTECWEFNGMCSKRCYKLFKNGGPDGNTIYNII